MEETLRRHIEKIVPLTDDEFAFILSHFSTKKFKKHQFLIQDGDANVNSYFVVSGLLKLIYTDDNARQHIVSFAMEDWWESDYQAFYTGTQATMSVQCLETTEVFSISSASYKMLLKGLPKLGLFFLEKSNLGFLASQRRLLFQLTSSVKVRYEKLVQRYPSLVHRVPKSQLAAYLGVSRETLSRIAKK
jgi:CRP-like cAMP-binding protein